MHTSNFFHKFITEFDTALRTLLPPRTRNNLRVSPAEYLADNKLSLAEKKQVIGLMRVNHAGEVCAQALYQGQALTAKLTAVKAQMQQAAKEEIDHLAWCEKRLNELDSRPSLLNPLWYSGSLLIGAVAGLVGDRFSLGFVAETERQVGHHLQSHLEKLPIQDTKTRTILKQMHTDETNHAEIAVQAGAIELPGFAKSCMTIMSKIMTTCSYYF